MRIVIPSRSRVGKVASLAYVPRRYNPTLVVPQEQLNEYTTEYPHVPILAPPVDGITATRQWILENLEDEYIFMLDDDARFFVREDLQSPKLTPMLGNQREIRKMWNAVEAAFQYTPWVGISYRGGNHTKAVEYVEAARSFSVWGINRPIIQRLGLRFDLTPVLEDAQVILHLLQAGIPNRVFYRWCWDQVSSNSAGGCSDWRTPPVQTAGARELHRLFPDWVKVVEKESKTGWFKGQTRTDVVIQWQKCYKKGLFNCCAL